MDKKVHEKRFNEALKNKRLILMQYSCSDFNKPPVKITSFFALKPFTDEEFGLNGNNEEFKIKLKDYFDNHKDYYFALWNPNYHYSFKNLDVLNEQELTEINNRVIDLDDVFEMYAEKNNQTYIRKVDNGFDTRYYFALLNNIEIVGNWIWGKNEITVKDYSALLVSSRIKVKVTARLISKLIDKTLNVSSDEKIIKKSKRIIGFSGKLLYWKKNIKLALKSIGLIGLGYLINLIIGLIANWISK